jgi:hypothetical protein
MEQVSENERFVVKNGIKRVYICVTMIGQVVLSPFSFSVCFPEILNNVYAYYFFSANGIDTLQF